MRLKDENDKEILKRFTVPATLKTLDGYDLINGRCEAVAEQVSASGKSDAMRASHEFDAQSKVSGMLRLKSDIRDIHDQFKALGLGSILVDQSHHKVEHMSNLPKEMDEELVFETSQDQA